MNDSSALMMMKDSMLESLDDKNDINDIINNDEFMTDTMAPGINLSPPPRSDTMIFDEMMTLGEDSLFSLDKNEDDDQKESEHHLLPQDHSCSSLCTPTPTMTVREDVLVEPTPINASLAVVVNRLPLEHLLNKQDLDTYDLFLKTFSSSLKTTEQPFEVTKLQPASFSSSSSAAAANMQLPNNSSNNNNNNNTFLPYMMFRKAHQDVEPWTTPLVSVHSVREHILTHHHQHNLLPLSSIFSSQDQQQLHLDNNMFDDDNNNDDASFLEDEETNSFTNMSVGSDHSVGGYCDDVAATSTGTSGSSTNNHLRSMQMEQWNARFQELVQFKQVYGHCLVPLNWPVNPPLGHWVKRQRYQYRIKHEGKTNVTKKSTLTDDCQMALQQLGFVWDSHAANWEERLGDLRGFKLHWGHVNVPKKFPQNPQLPVWVKCQRRQYKLFRSNQKSHMTTERIEKLTSLGFRFDPQMEKSTTSSTSKGT